MSLDGASDNGCTIFYKYLDQRFPGSKFVLTTRDLELWLPSIEYITTRDPVGPKDNVQIQRRMLLYETVDFDRDKMIAAYHRHHADVRRYFRNRPDDLLEMDITKGDGWEKLCPFLGLAVPNVAFPLDHQRKENQTTQRKFWNRLRRIV